MILCGFNPFLHGQICWLWQKVEADGPGERGFQRFLDTSQYTLNGILRYEWIFGEGYVSTGGKGLYVLHELLIESVHYEFGCGY